MIIKIIEFNVLTPALHGEIKNISTDHVKFHFTNGTTGQKTDGQINKRNYIYYVDYLIEWLEKECDFSSVKAIGHRIVFGMKSGPRSQVTFGFYIKRFLNCQPFRYSQSS